MEVLRRSTAPAIVRELFVAIKFIRDQRQIANLKRIIKYMEREHKYTPTQTLHYLHDAVLDALVVETVTVGNKGSKDGVEQEGYWIAQSESIFQDIKNSRSDWYCYKCQMPGRVLPCSSCFKVFHFDCLDAAQQPKNTGSWVCPNCLMTKLNIPKQKQKELGKCLIFVVTQLKDSFPSLVDRPDAEEYPYYDHFVFGHYDLTMMERDCNGGVFRSVDHFRDKLRDIHRNYCLALGEDDQLTETALELIDESKHELTELQICRNCFILSNTKPFKDWFCRPCEPAHPVVWAKQRGYDFWPAKVIRTEVRRIDVRFFGRDHPRAWVHKSAVRPITISPAELKVKRKAPWVEANNEMKEYIRQCESTLGKEKASKIIRYDPGVLASSASAVDKNPVKSSRNGESRMSGDMKATRVSRRIHSERLPSTDDPPPAADTGRSTSTSVKRKHSDRETSSRLSRQNMTSTPQQMTSTPQLKSVRLELMKIADSPPDSNPQRYAPTTSLPPVTPAESESNTPSLHDRSPGPRDQSHAASCMPESTNPKTECAELDKAGSRSEVAKGGTSCLPSSAAVGSSSLTFADHSTQTDEARQADKQMQVLLAELGGYQCSCKLRYSFLLKQFTDYFLEYSKLEKVKILQAAAKESEEERRAAEEAVREEMRRQHDQHLTQLRLQHQLALRDARHRCEGCKTKKVATNSTESDHRNSPDRHQPNNMGQDQVVDTHEHSPPAHLDDITDDVVMSDQVGATHGEVTSEQLDITDDVVISDQLNDVTNHVNDASYDVDDVANDVVISDQPYGVPNNVVTSEELDNAANDLDDVTYDVNDVANDVVRSNQLD